MSGNYCIECGSCYCRHVRPSRQPVAETDAKDKQSFPTGAVRDTQDNKPRLDLLSWPELERVSQHYANGAKHYGEFNWQKGIPSSRYLQSLLRHVSALAQGKTNEDHASAIVFNVKGIMYNQRAFKDNPEINDLPGWEPG